MPYTDDIDLVMKAIDSISVPTSYYAGGSSLNIPYETIIATLKTAQNKERKQFLFFISDGEITDNSSLNSYKGVSKYLDGGAVLGYGTKDGGKMKTKRFDQTSEDEYVYIMINGKREFGISKIDEINLKTIANDMNINYIKMDNTFNIDEKIDEILQNLIVKPEEKDLDWYDDTYYYLMIPLILMFIWKFYLMRRA